MTTPTMNRLTAAICTAAIAVGLAACGDNDDNESGDSAANTPAAQDGADATAGKETKPATDEGQIKALVADVEQAFKTGDGETICNGLTAAGQADMVAYGKVVDIPGGTCPDIAKGIVKNNRKDGVDTPPSRVVTVRVRGNKATALLRVGGSGTLPQRYVKDNGQWKLRTYGLGKAVGATPTQ